MSSGVRCQAHNDELPGSAKNSYHHRGKAVDFCVRGVPGATLLSFGLSESTVTQIVAIIMAGADVLAYIIAEGMVDAANKDANTADAGSGISGTVSIP